MQMKARAKTNKCSLKTTRDERSHALPRMISLRSLSSSSFHWRRNELLDQSTTTQSNQTKPNRTKLNQFKWRKDFRRIPMNLRKLQRFSVRIGSHQRPLLLFTCAFANGMDEFSAGCPSRQWSSRSTREFCYKKTKLRAGRQAGRTENG